MADPGGEGPTPTLECRRMSVIRMEGAVNGYGHVIAHEALLTLGQID